MDSYTPQNKTKSGIVHRVHSPGFFGWVRKGKRLTSNSIPGVEICRKLNARGERAWFVRLLHQLPSCCIAWYAAAAARVTFDAGIYEHHTNSSKLYAVPVPGMYALCRLVESRNDFLPDFGGGSRLQGRNAVRRGVTSELFSCQRLLAPGTSDPGRDVLPGCLRYQPLFRYEDPPRSNGAMIRYSYLQYHVTYARFPASFFHTTAVSTRAIATTAVQQ